MSKKQEQDELLNEEEMSADQKEAAEESGSEQTDDLLLEQQQRINELEEELNKVKDTMLRKTADIENQRKRLRRDRDQAFVTAKERAVDAFLPVNDDLLRTIQALENSDVDSSILDGIRMVANKFENVLNSYGVERIDETGVPFDVDLHDAMMRQKPQDDSVESGTVMQVIENGYRMGEKTLRHAKVIVSE